MVRNIQKVTPLLSQPDESASENLHTLSSQYQETLTTDCRPWNAGGYKTQTRYKMRTTEYLGKNCANRF